MSWFLLYEVLYLFLFDHIVTHDFIVLTNIDNLIDVPDICYVFFIVFLWFPCLSILHLDLTTVQSKRKLYNLNENCNNLNEKKEIIT